MSIVFIVFIGTMTSIIIKCLWWNEPFSWPLLFKAPNSPSFKQHNSAHISVGYKLFQIFFHFFEYLHVSFIQNLRFQQNNIHIRSTCTDRSDLFNKNKIILMLKMLKFHLMPKSISISFARWIFVHFSRMFNV